MPLKCVTPEGEALFAFNYDAEAWRALTAANRRDRNLVMSCCGRPVVLKTSHCGTRFFAHAPREGSACPRESEEHLQAKDLIARAVVQAGWAADTEAPLNPHKLVADVLGTKGSKRVAFEVQWSRQKMADTISRHHAYEQAGVHALWLFKQTEYPVSKETPSFRLVRDTDSETFHVWVWHEGRTYSKPSEAAQVVELQTFIYGALAGRLKWMPAQGLTVPVMMHKASLQCRRGHETKVLAALELDVGQVLPGHANPTLSVEEFGEHPEFLRTQHAKALLAANELTIGFGMSNFKIGRGPDNFRRWAHACCSRCGEILSDWELKDAPREPCPDSELDLELSPRLVNSIPQLSRALQRWWFDTRNSGLSAA